MSNFRVFLPFLEVNCTDSTLGDCHTVTGPNLCANCVFPFKYRGETFYGCTHLNQASLRPWCATNETYDENEFNKNKLWGDCSESCLTHEEVLRKRKRSEEKSKLRKEKKNKRYIKKKRKKKRPVKKRKRNKKKLKLKRKKKVSKMYQKR